MTSLTPNSTAPARSQVRARRDSERATALARRLQTEHLSVHFGGRSALEDITLAFQPGQMTALVGPNGAGKSTLLKCLAGMLKPTHGHVLLDGQPVTKPSAQVAYVPQRSEVDWRFPITVLDVAVMGRAMHGNRLLPLAAADRQDALAALDEVGMLGFAGVQIGALSGGQQQRVFLARALLQPASAYLLDEPFTGVDLPTQRLVLEILADLRQTGKTIVFATHDLSMAAEAADACVLLNRRVMAAGRPRVVLTAEHLRDTFGGAALLPMPLEN